MQTILRIALAQVLLFLLSWSLVAQPVEEDLPQITGCIALINARVVKTAGSEPQTANVIIRNGIITQVGSSATIPPDAYRIAADSFYVYPAFIDALSHAGIKSAEGENEGRGGQGGPGNRGGNRPVVDAEGNMSLEEAGITPFISTRATFDPKEKSISDWRNQGFAITHVVPKGKMMPGKGAIVVLSGKSTDEVLWKEDVSLYSQWNGAGNGYPSTVIAIMSKWRELAENAHHAAAHQTSYETASLVTRPVYNQAHEAMIPVIKKTLPVYFRAPKVKDIYRALDLQQDLDLNMIISDAEEAWYLATKLKSSSTPLILSLDLPEDKTKTGDKSKQGPAHDTPKTTGGDVKESTTAPDENTSVAADTVAVDPEKAAFEKRRAESRKAYLTQASVLAEEDIPFSFSTMSIKPGDFSKNITTMMENGLTADDALHALTMQPAQLLGIEKYCGTVEAGKMANLIIATKPVFEKDWAIKYMVVEGNVFAYEVKEKKKPEPAGKEVTAYQFLLGQWEYFAEMPQGRTEGHMDFVMQDGSITGEITSDQITSGHHTLDNIVVTGQDVSFTYDLDADGTMIELEFELKVDGEEFKGTATVPGVGIIPITGHRISKPE